MLTEIFVLIVSITALVEAEVRKYSGSAAILSRVHGDRQYSPLGPSPHRGAKMDAAPTMVATRAMPRMLSRGNYATHSELAEHGSGCVVAGSRCCVL